jgi:hypothetical protein
MSYELTAICDGCGTHVTFQVGAFGRKFERTTPYGAREI